jgi:hypothetical protein
VFVSRRLIDISDIPARIRQTTANDVQEVFEAIKIPQISYRYVEDGSANGCRSVILYPHCMLQQTEVFGLECVR